MIQAPQGDLINEQSYWLTEAQIERLKPFFPKSHGKPRVDDRRVLIGIFFINRNGLRWCDGEGMNAIDEVDGSRLRHRNVPCWML